MWLPAALLLVNTVLDVGILFVQGATNSYKQLDAGRMVRPKRMQNLPFSFQSEVAALMIPKRDVRVWLPPDYSERTATRHPVLYCHDGQHIIAENNGFLQRPSWELGETLTTLIATDQIDGPSPIVVLIDNCHKVVIPSRVAEAHLRN
jgi:enterochelin esterase-like enzyme